MRVFGMGRIKGSGVRRLAAAALALVMGAVEKHTTGPASFTLSNVTFR